MSENPNGESCRDFVKVSVGYDMTSKLFVADATLPGLAVTAS
jgi:hypothetical protein